MAALNGMRVVAGLMVGAAVVGLCSCSTDTTAADPTGGPTANVEQTISPSPSPSADSDFVVRTACLLYTSDAADE